MSGQDDFWWVHTVSVETYLGSGSFGDVYADPVSVDCWVDDAVKLVNNTQGEQVVSNSTVYAPTDAASSESATAGQFAPGSKVTMPSGHVGFVIRCGVFDSGALDMELDHVAANIT